MVDIEVFATGSSGNCTCLTFDDGKKFLLDAGIPFNKIQNLMKGKLPDAVLITHEHGDHAHLPTVKEFLKRGVDVCLTEETAEALGLEQRHNLKMLDIRINSVQNHFFTIFPVEHDADNPANAPSITDRSINLYVTDAGVIPTLPTLFSYNKILIETNYSKVRLMNNRTDKHSKSVSPKKTYRLSKRLTSIKGLTASA